MHKVRKKDLRDHTGEDRGPHCDPGVDTDEEQRPPRTLETCMEEVTDTGGRTQPMTDKSKETSESHHSGSRV